MQLQIAEKIQKIMFLKQHFYQPLVVYASFIILGKVQPKVSRKLKRKN